MDIKLLWNEGMHFSAQTGENSISMDAKPPMGKGTAPTPKELVVMGMAGCTAMDVVALLKKYKQPMESFTVETQVIPTEGVYPAVFKSAHIVYKLSGELDSQKVLEAVTLSQTKYCGVSAMLSKAFPITWEIVLNGNLTGAGKADF